MVIEETPESQHEHTQQHTTTGTCQRLSSKFVQTNLSLFENASAFLVTSTTDACRILQIARIYNLQCLTQGFHSQVILWWRHANNHGQDTLLFLDNAHTQYPTYSSDDETLAAELRGQTQLALGEPLTDWEDLRPGLAMLFPIKHHKRPQMTRQFAVRVQDELFTDAYGKHQTSSNKWKRETFLQEVVKKYFFQAPPDKMFKMDFNIFQDHWAYNVQYEPGEILNPNYNEHMSRQNPTTLFSNMDTILDQFNNKGTPASVLLKIPRGVRFTKVGGKYRFEKFHPIFDAFSEHPNIAQIIFEGSLYFENSEGQTPGPCPF